MGGIYPEYFPYWFVDHWFQEIGKRVGREVFARVWVDCSKKQPTIGLRDQYFWGQVFGLLTPERETMAEHIMDDMKITSHGRDILRRNWPLLDQWSWLINETLEKDTPQGSGDPGYQRLVDKVLAIVNPRQKAQEEANKAALAKAKAA